ncbi:hypothetical protein GW17_00047748 [Ensete ventricosum]|nr:hypothetical protein GW17_00047748 [Ensete ventricosum]
MQPVRATRAVAYRRYRLWPGLPQAGAAAYRGSRSLLGHLQQRLLQAKVVPLVGTMPIHKVDHPRVMTVHNVVAYVRATTAAMRIGQ